MCVQADGLCPRRLSVCLQKGCYADLPALSPCACRLTDYVRADWRSAYNNKAAMQTHPAVIAMCVQADGLCPRRLSVCLRKGCYADLSCRLCLQWELSVPSGAPSLHQASSCLSRLCLQMELSVPCGAKGLHQASESLSRLCLHRPAVCRWN